MFLVDGVEKSGTNRLVAVLFRKLAKFSETERVAIGFATFREVWESFVVDVTDEFVEAVFVFDDEFCVYFFGVGF